MPSFHKIITLRAPILRYPLHPSIPRPIVPGINAQVFDTPRTAHLVPLPLRIAVSATPDGRSAIAPFSGRTTLQPYKEYLAHARLAAVRTIRLYSHGQTSEAYGSDESAISQKRRRTIVDQTCHWARQLLEIHAPVRQRRDEQSQQEMSIESVTAQNVQSNNDQIDWPMAYGDLDDYEMQMEVPEQRASVITEAMDVDMTSLCNESNVNAEWMRRVHERRGLSQREIMKMRPGQKVKNLRARVEQRQKAQFGYCPVPYMTVADLQQLPPTTYRQLRATVRHRLLLRSTPEIVYTSPAPSVASAIGPEISTQLVAQPSSPDLAKFDVIVDDLAQTPASLAGSLFSENDEQPQRSPSPVLSAPATTTIPSVHADVDAFLATILLPAPPSSPSAPPTGPDSTADDTNPQNDNNGEYDDDELDRAMEEFANRHATPPMPGAQDYEDVLDFLWSPELPATPVWESAPSLAVIPQATSPALDWLTAMPQLAATAPVLPSESFNSLFDEAPPALPSPLLEETSTPAPAPAPSSTTPPLPSPALSIPFSPVAPPSLVFWDDDSAMDVWEEDFDNDDSDLTADDVSPMVCDEDSMVLSPVISGTSFFDVLVGYVTRNFGFLRIT